MRITKITRLHPGTYAHICPLCGDVYASACDPDLMPEFSICECDRNGNKQSVYELFEFGGKTMIRRNKYPRFTGEVTFGELSDIENILLLDNCTDQMEMAKSMRKAGEFLIKSGNKT